MVFVDSTVVTILLLQDRRCKATVEYGLLKFIPLSTADLPRQRRRLAERHTSDDPPSKQATTIIPAAREATAPVEQSFRNIRMTTEAETAATVAVGHGDGNNTNLQPTSPSPSPPKVRILFCDSHIVVIDKPRNLRSVPGHARQLVDLSIRNGDAEAEVVEEEESEVQQDTGGRRDQSSCSPHTDSNKRTAPAADDDDNCKNNRKHSKRTKKNGSPSATRMSPQEAWVRAVESFAAGGGDGDSGADGCDDNNFGGSTNGAGNDYSSREIDLCLSNLSGAGGSNGNRYVASIPRKYKLFEKYLWRSRKRIFGDRCKEAKDENDDVKKSFVAGAARRMHARIAERHRALLNLPEPTAPELSAYGQLLQMLSASSSSSQQDACHTKNSQDQQLPPLYVVHRLDCATSGVMVFARTEEAVSRLSRAWRERSHDADSGVEGGVDDNNGNAVVRKEYLAEVHGDWPALFGGRTSGRIHLNVAPSDTERLKWRVVGNHNGNGSGGDKEKPSTTLWKFLSYRRYRGGDGPTKGTTTSVLKLIPITGRTHQLRVHCAHYAEGGIVGDSLYGLGYRRTNSRPDDRLRLHAHRLSFPYPAGEEVTASSGQGRVMEFVADPPADMQQS